MPTPTVALAAALVQQLQTALPPLAEAEGLPPVLDFLDYDPAFFDPTKAPYVWVDIPDDTRSAAEERGATIGKYSHITTATVGILVAGEDPSAAIRQHRAYLDLIPQAVQANQKPVTGVLWVRWRRTRSTGNSAEGAGLLKIALLDFDINRRSRNDGT